MYKSGICVKHIPDATILSCLLFYENHCYTDFIKALEPCCRFQIISFCYDIAYSVHLQASIKNRFHNISEMTQYSCTCLFDYFFLSLHYINLMYKGFNFFKQLDIIT